MGFLIWKKSDIKIFLGINIGLIIAILLILPPNLWGELLDYFLETPPLLIFGQLGTLLICSSLLFILITFIWRLLK